MGTDLVFSPAVAPMSPPEGFNNADLQAARERILKGGTYRDCSTVCLLPTRDDGALHFKVADALKGLMSPMNQKFTTMRLAGMEVADAYNQGIQAVLAHPELSKWPFILTCEHDNVPPPDGLLKLAESMLGGPWAGVSGLYWCKGENGAPMIFGDVKDPEVNFRPQPPVIENIQECRGIAMGFALWDMELFRDQRLGPPWFRTPQRFTPYMGTESGTQDLDWCRRASELGYRFAVDTRVRVGHVQFEKSQTHPAGFVW